MKIGLIEPHYLPSLEYFCVLLPLDKIVLEQHEHYVKQSFRNRCHINTTQGRVMLVVPLTQKHGKVQLKDIRIDNSLKWQNNHWRTIQSAYARSPFFEHYRDELNKILFGNDTYLFDLDRNLLSFCLRNLGLEKAISETVAYEKEPNSEISDLRSQITSKKPPSDRSFYQPRPYHQVFGNAFAGNLSVIDLLFCEGPGALTILKASEKKN
jgi:WbqC-like protein family